MRNRILFIIAAIGLALAVLSAFLSAQQPAAQPPVFSPAANPYSKGIYANGIIESDQRQGENLNLYPEVSGPITRVLISEGQRVRKDDPLLTIDDSVQRATAEQQRAQAEAALATLKELRAEPRPETLAVARAQVASARASLKSASDQSAKQERSYAMDPKSVSLDTLDNARNAMKIAGANLEVAEKQYTLTRAGAWKFDIENQERQYAALTKAYSASAALLAKYTIRAPADGVVLAVAGALGSYASPQGVYDSYTQGEDPLIVMGMPEHHLAVRVYVDEILVHRLPQPARMTATMFIRGTNIRLPLTFERIQPYVSPKIELSDQRLERVDVRVLPIVFRFEKPPGLQLYPGQLVDVYVGEK
jgi:HlyD family secretion protein